MGFHWAESPSFPRLVSLGTRYTKTLDTWSKQESWRWRIGDRSYVGHQFVGPDYLKDKMHFSVPDTVELTDKSGSKYLVSIQLASDKNSFDARFKTHCSCLVPNNLLLHIVMLFLSKGSQAQFFQQPKQIDSYKVWFLHKRRYFYSFMSTEGRAFSVSLNVVINIRL